MSEIGLPEGVTPDGAYVQGIADCEICARTGRHYKVVRFYANKPGYRRTIIERCTLEEAQRHCSDPETSSSTCKGSWNKARTRRHGPWFDGYEER
jgi:hypothetical protein